jgi:hypothetical protein
MQVAGLKSFNIPLNTCYDTVDRANGCNEKEMDYVATPVVTFGSLNTKYYYFHLVKGNRNFLFSFFQIV